MLFLKLVFIGAPCLGKTTMRRRLTREIDDIESSGEAEQPSTGTVESEHTVVVRNISSTTAVVTQSEWSASKDISQEASMVLQFIFQTTEESENDPKAEVAEKESPDTLQLGKKRKGFKQGVVSFLRKNFKIKDTKSKKPLSTATASATSSDDMADAEFIMSDDEILDFFTQALSTNWDEIKFLLDNTALLSMADTGGQPEFMDMQPALVIGPALYLIFCKLTQSLQSHYSISYRSSSGNSSVPIESTYTVEETIFQALSAIACLSSASDVPNPLSPEQGTPSKSDSNTLPIDGTALLSAGNTASKVSSKPTPLVTSPLTPSKSKAIIVGTHSDLVSEEEIQAFDADLQQRI